MLGSDLAAACTARGYRVDVYDMPEFDIADPVRVEQAVSDADLVVNCAAYTDVDGAERDAQTAHAVNGKAVGCLGGCAAEQGKWVLHFSTDFVFDGTLDRPYVESDVPNPISEYGRSKLAGERLLEASGCSHCIVRIEWTYGLQGRSFITKILDKARTGEPLRVVDDQVGSPTATTVVAEVACELLEHRVTGLFHLAGDGCVSRFGVAQFIVDQMRLGVDVQPCRTSDYVTPAQRPLNSRFDCSKIKMVLDHALEPWQQPLERFLGQLDA